MNKQQFELIADKILRKKAQRNAVYEVLFEGKTPYRAERDNKCSPGSVYPSVAAVNKHYDHCVAVVSAK